MYIYTQIRVGICIEYILGGTTNEPHSNVAMARTSTALFPGQKECFSFSFSFSFSS